jgi:hypothetical protein
MNKKNFNVTKRKPSSKVYEGKQVAKISNHYNDLIEVTFVNNV